MLSYCLDVFWGRIQHVGYAVPHREAGGCGTIVTMIAAAIVGSSAERAYIACDNRCKYIEVGDVVHL